PLRPAPRDRRRTDAAALGLPRYARRPRRLRDAGGGARRRRRNADRQRTGDRAHVRRRPRQITGDQRKDHDGMTAPINFTEINGLRIAEARYAHPNGAPVLMLHGWGADISLMQPLAERLAPLGYAIYLIDLPGFGQSAPPPT